MPHRTPRPLRLLASLLCAFAAGAALADDVRLYGAAEAVSPQEVARILEARPIKMRSLRLLDDAPATRDANATTNAAAGTTANATTVAAATTHDPGAVADEAPRRAPGALALPVQFAFDSSELLPAARPQLDALAEGIRLLPERQAVVIEGHTDVRGSDAYNEQLSLQRAQAVRRYLVGVHRIDPARLRAVGLGEYALLAGLDPRAAEQRRVQFRGE